MKKGKLIICWDYELQKGADTSVLGYNDGIEDYNQTKFILQYLKERNIKTCFAVLGYAAEPGGLPYHAPEQIRQMAEEGHEVGSHTHNHKRISRLSYKELLEELRRSKDVIEKASGIECTAFVSPWDKPQYFLKAAIDFKPNTFPRLSQLSRGKICLALKRTGYQTYRIAPLTSRFNKLGLSRPFNVKGVINIPCKLSNGFGIDAKNLVKKAIEKKGLAVVYAHPRGLAHPGPQNRENFKSFIDFVSKQVEGKKLEIILPRDLIKN